MFDDEVLAAAEALLTKVRARGAFLTTAESCTGGLIAAALTSIAGASDCFHQGFVTYSNEAKHQLLGVDEALLARHGAVSEVVAGAMAIGALERITGPVDKGQVDTGQVDTGQVDKSPADKYPAEKGAGLALAVTGIAGPGGGSAEKPVGLIYIGALFAEKGEDVSPLVKRFEFGPIGRDAVRRESVLAALSLGLAVLEGR